MKFFKPHIIFDKNKIFLDIIHWTIEPESIMEDKNINLINMAHHIPWVITLHLKNNYYIWPIGAEVLYYTNTILQEPWVYHYGHSINLPLENTPLIIKDRDNNRLDKLIFIGYKILITHCQYGNTTIIQGRLMAS